MLLKDSQWAKTGTSEAQTPMHLNLKYCEIDPTSYYSLHSLPTGTLKIVMPPCYSLCLKNFFPNIYMSHSLTSLECPLFQLPFLKLQVLLSDSYLHAVCLQNIYHHLTHDVIFLSFFTHHTVSCVRDFYLFCSLLLVRTISGI